MCDISQDEGAEVWRESVHRARKAYRCDGCGATIGAGQPYTGVFSVFDGNPLSEKMCAPCWFAREEFAEAHDEQTFAPSILVEMLRDCIADDDGDGERWRPVLADVLGRAKRVSR